MKKRSLFQLALLGPAYACATAVFGWWAVPVLAGVWGLYERSDNRPTLVAALGAGFGWALLMLWTASKGPALDLSARASAVLAVPGVTLILLTVMFPMVLAWGAGSLAENGKYYWTKLRSVQRNRISEHMKGRA